MNLEKFSLHDLDILVKTVYGEARGESRKGQIAVVHVIFNRSADSRRRWPKGIASVCLQKKQFSCWNQNDPNRAKIERLTPANPDYRSILETVLAALRTTDPTDGANHYYARSIPIPYWAKRMIKTARIGNHLFYKG